MISKAIAFSAALLMGTAAFAVSNAVGLESRNEALVNAITAANAAYNAGRFAEALAKAKEADAIKDGKPAELNPKIHDMIIAAALGAKDYDTAMAQYEKNIQAGEGNRVENLKRAISVAIMAKNKEKTDQYAKELGGNLDNATRLYIANGIANAGQLKEALEYAKPALEGNPGEEALKFEQAVYFRMNDSFRRREALEQLVTNYPKPEYWHDLLQIARNEKGLSDDQVMDIYRLRYVLGDLKTETDFQEMAQEALVAGYATEAKGVLEKAQADKILKGERDQRLVKMASDRAAQDGAVVADLQKRAKSDPNSAIKLGLLYWSTGKDKEAEDTIRGAIASNKLADPEGAKVALGHVLLSEGKASDAATAFNSVAKNVRESNVARLWAIYARHPDTKPEKPTKAAAPERRRG